jgi:hypothetical protein
MKQDRRLHGLINGRQLYVTKCLNIVFWRKCETSNMFRQEEGSNLQHSFKTGSLSDVTLFTIQIGERDKAPITRHKLKEDVPS